MKYDLFEKNIMVNIYIYKANILFNLISVLLSQTGWLTKMNLIFFHYLKKRKSYSQFRYESVQFDTLTQLRT